MKFESEVKISTFVLADNHSQTFERIFARKDKSFGLTETVGEFEIYRIFDKFSRVEFRSESSVSSL